MTDTRDTANMITNARAKQLIKHHLQNTFGFGPDIDLDNIFGASVYIHHKFIADLDMEHVYEIQVCGGERPSTFKWIHGKGINIKGVAHRIAKLHSEKVAKRERARKYSAMTAQSEAHLNSLIGHKLVEGTVEDDFASEVTANDLGYRVDGRRFSFVTGDSSYQSSRKLSADQIRALLDAGEDLGFEVTVRVRCNKLDANQIHAVADALGDTV